MNIYFYFFMISGSLAMILLMLGSSLSLSRKPEQEKLSAFECGFIAHEEMRSQFSSQFFLVSLIFLVFDIELIILFPSIMAINSAANMMESLMFMLFLSILSVGLFYEWEKGMLEWKF